MTRDEYLAADVWNLREYPHPFVRSAFERKIAEPILNFSSIQNETVKRQVKQYAQYWAEEELQKYKAEKNPYDQSFRALCYGIRFLSETDIKYEDMQVDHQKLAEGYVEYGIRVLGLSGALTHIGTIYMPNNPMHSIYNFLIYYQNKDKVIWDRSIWYRDDLHLSPERVNPTSAFNTIRLDYLKEGEERNCVVLYLKYMIVETKIAFATIYSRNIEIKLFANYIHEKHKTLLTVDRADVEQFYVDYGAMVVRTSVDGRISTLFHFYEYLQAYSIIQTNPFSMHDRSNDRYHYKLKTVEDYTVRQIFGALDKIDEKLTCMFLTIFCTGMRVSEMCQIQSDSLSHNEKGYFIQFYNQKLRKHVMNQIPEALAEKIQNEINKHPEEQYAFPRAKGQPYLASTFQDQLNKAIEPFDIRFPNGDPFIFRPHDWRHTLATKMYKSDIDISIIQNVLHHKSIEMTMAYVECDEDQMKRKQHKYLNYRGEEIGAEEDKVRMSEMRESIRSQLLPNGMCALPVGLGKCPHANACMDGCPYFRTDKRYLPVHLQYLEDLTKYVNMCNENGWKTQYEAASRVRSNVLNLIRRLENE